MYYAVNVHCWLLFVIIFVLLISSSVEVTMLLIADFVEIGSYCKIIVHLLWYLTGSYAIINFGEIANSYDPITELDFCSYKLM